MTKGHPSGTMAKSTMAVHGGKVAGAGELGRTMASPGTAAKKVKPKMSGLPFQGAKNVKNVKSDKAKKQDC
jgi:hypothetical protein